LHNNTGKDAYPERSDRNTDAYLKRIASGSKMRIMGREVVVTVTNGRLDGSTELAEVFGTWERIFQGQAEWLAREC
jgi:hypothetical protein